MCPFIPWANNAGHILQCFSVGSGRIEPILDTLMTNFRQYSCVHSPSLPVPHSLFPNLILRKLVKICYLPLDTSPRLFFSGEELRLPHRYFHRQSFFYLKFLLVTNKPLGASGIVKFIGLENSMKI